MRIKILLPIAATAVLSLAACDGSPTDPTTEVLIGVLGPSGAEGITVSPSEGAVEVEVVTAGNGCYSRGDVLVAREGATATITPRDHRTLVPGEACSDIGLSFRHTARVEFSEARPWTVVVRVRAEESSEELSEFTFTIG